MFKKKWFITAIIGGLSFLGTGAANAAAVTFSTSSTSFTVGSQIAFDLQINFTDTAILGGGLDVLYGSFTNNNQLTFLSYTPSATIGLDASLGRTPDIQSNKLNGIGFGNFSGLTGPGSIGQLIFTANTPGSYSLGLGINTADVGGFFDVNGNALPGLSLGSINFQVSSAVSPVPAPASLPLLLSGLAGIWGMVQRRRVAA
jgi:hypothetical protein